MLVAFSINILISTGVLIYTQIQYLRSSHFDPQYASTRSAYDKGYFSLEAWTCETPRYIDDVCDYEFGIQCSGEKASRGLLVAMWLCSLAVLGFLMWDYNGVGKQVVVRKKKRKMMGEMDPYFGDEEEMYL
jgi:hypothetical protein